MDGRVEQVAGQQPQQAPPWENLPWADVPRPEAPSDSAGRWVPDEVPVRGTSRPATVVLAASVLFVFAALTLVAAVEAIVERGPIGVLGVVGAALFGLAGALGLTGSRGWFIGGGVVLLVIGLFSVVGVLRDAPGGVETAIWLADPVLRLVGGVVVLVLASTPGARAWYDSRALWRTGRDEYGSGALFD